MALALWYRNDPKVDKITGPGNIFVATAKKQVYGIVGIDMDCRTRNWSHC